MDLLLRLKNRDDLFAKVAQEIDDLIRDIGGVEEFTPPGSGRHRPEDQLIQPRPEKPAKLFGDGRHARSQQKTPFVVSPSGWVFISPILPVCGVVAMLIMILSYHLNSPLNLVPPFLELCQTIYMLERYQSVLFCIILQLY